MNSPKKTKITAAARIASQISKEILEGRLSAGEPLREEELAKEFSASRHVIREMLQLLVSKGLAQYSAFKGARVATISSHRVVEIYSVRRFIECNAVREFDCEKEFRNIASIHQKFSTAVERKDWSAAFQADNEFHSAFLLPLQIDMLSAWHMDLFQSLHLAHLTCASFREPGLISSVSEHAEIVVALGAGNTDRAAQLLEAHLVRAEQILLNAIGESKIQKPSE